MWSVNLTGFKLNTRTLGPCYKGLRIDPDPFFLGLAY